VKRPHFLCELDLLLGMGFSSLILTLRNGGEFELNPQNSDLIYLTNNMFLAFIFIMFTLVLSITLVPLFKFRYTKQMGVVLILNYVSFTILSFLSEFGILFENKIIWFDHWSRFSVSHNKIQCKMWHLIQFLLVLQRIFLLTNVTIFDGCLLTKYSPASYFQHTAHHFKWYTSLANWYGSNIHVRTKRHFFTLSRKTFQKETKGS
jgi:hypothetical protein